MASVLERPMRKAARPTPRYASVCPPRFLASESIEHNIQTGPLQEDALAQGATSKTETGWTKILSELDSFRVLGDDWDGQGARQPSDDIVDSAVALLELQREKGQLTPPSAVAPGPNGTILVVWEEPDGTYCEVEVVRPLFAEVMLKRPGQPSQHWTIPN